MQSKEQIEGNRLIAVWMGWTIEPGMEDIPNPYYNRSGGSGGWGMVTLSAMKYHTSWDWLLPVVQKIYTMQDYRHCEAYYNVSHMFIIATIEQVYHAILAFIKYFNALKQSK